MIGEMTNEMISVQNNAFTAHQSLYKGSLNDILKAKEKHLFTTGELLKDNQEYYVLVTDKTENVKINDFLTKLSDTNANDWLARFKEIQNFEKIGPLDKMP